MKKFMDDSFLLENEVAEELFQIASKEPIFDYHCHLSPKEIYENNPFSDISAVWLGGDHYKWRVMRSFGIDEKFITGKSTGYEKFTAWAKVLPYCIGNPLYHWTHLELQRFFGIDTLLSSRTADEIWNLANEKLKSLTPRDMIKHSNVAALCTSDDPVDDLGYHKMLREDKSFGVHVLPAFRPDKALNPTAKAFTEWTKKLSEASGIPVRSFMDLKAALTNRIEYFKSLGCVASDHAFVYVPFSPADDVEIEAIFRKAMGGNTLEKNEIEKYQTALMIHLAAEYKKHDIAMELHIGAMRNNNAKSFDRLGPDTGYDSVDDHRIAQPLSAFLNHLEYRGILPKTILFTMNPKDNYVLASMLGNFQSSEVSGKLQFGAAWWMNDHIDGMLRQMRDYADIDVLGKFVGMVTDSRSFLSYPRHEYFRRILCNMLGGLVEKGQYPYDMETLSDIIRGISFENAKAYFGL